MCETMVDHWRSKVENQHSKDFLFIDANGKPFYNAESVEPGARLRMLVNRHIQPKVYEIYPEYYPYCSRHFCGVARLLRSYRECGVFDIYKVGSFLGHEKIGTTKGYVKGAELFLDDFNFDWINRILKMPSRCGVNTGKNQKRSKISSFDENLSEKGERRPPDSNRRPLGCCKKVCFF